MFTQQSLISKYIKKCHDSDIKKKLEDDNNSKGDDIKFISYLLQAKKNIPSGIYDVLVEYTINTLYFKDKEYTDGYEVIKRKEDMIRNVSLKILVL